MSVSGRGMGLEWQCSQGGASRHRARQAKIGFVPMVIVLLDLDKGARRAEVAALRFGGHEVATVDTVEQAITYQRGHRVDAVVIDPVRADVTQMMGELRARTELPVVVVTSARDELDAETALDAGADDFVAKPFRVEELLARVRAVARRAQKSEARHPNISHRGGVPDGGSSASAPGSPRLARTDPHRDLGPSPGAESQLPPGVRRHGASEARTRPCSSALFAYSDRSWTCVRSGKPSHKSRRRAWTSSVISNWLPSEPCRIRLEMRRCMPESQLDQILNSAEDREKSS